MSDDFAQEWMVRHCQCGYTCGIKAGWVLRSRKTRIGNRRPPWTDTWRNLPALSSSRSMVSTSIYHGLQPVSVALRGLSLPVPSLPARGVRSVVASVSRPCACLDLASAISRLHFWSLARTSMKAPAPKGKGEHHLTEPCSLLVARQHPPA